MSSTERDVINAAGGKVQGGKSYLNTLGLQMGRFALFAEENRTVPINFKFMHLVDSWIMIRLIWAL